MSIFLGTKVRSEKSIYCALNINKCDNTACSRRGAPTGRFLRTNDSLHVVMQIDLDSPFSKSARASGDAHARASPTFQTQSSVAALVSNARTFAWVCRW